jgi:carboxyl-terminal processing protease
MMHSQFLNRLRMSLISLGLSCSLAASSSFAQKFSDLRSRTTVDKACEYGTEIELKVRQGDVVRLALKPNPSGIGEFFLLPLEDTLGWRFPSCWGTDRGPSGGSRYENLRDSFIGLGYEAMANLKVSQGRDKRVTIKVLVDDKKKFAARNRTHSLERAEERRKEKEEQRRRANVIGVEERVAGFVRLWSEVKYNFAFFERTPKLDWDKVLEEFLPKILKEQTTEEYYRLLERCVAQLKDGHTTVYPPSNLRDEKQLPVRLRLLDDKVIVSEIAEAAAAAEPRLKAGLEVTHIDGRPVAEILKQDVYPYIADSTPQNRDRWAVRRLIEGDAGSQAKVRLQNASGKSFDLMLAHSTWRYPQISSYEYQDAGEGMAYVALNSFSSRAAASSFARAMEEIGRHRGLLIDMRNNGGGSSREGYLVISRLIDKPARGSKWRTRQYVPTFRAWGEKETWLKHEGSVIRPATGERFLGPVVVLIGPGTVSAAEDFVVAIHAAGRATLVGEKTAGTTGQPLMVKLPRGGSARICTKWDSYPDGREFVGVGVIPDVEVHPTRDSLAAGRDAVLEKGLEMLGKQIGRERVDAVGLAARLVAQRTGNSTARKLRELPMVLKEAQAEYASLAAAYAEKDWRTIDRQAKGLSELFRRELLIAWEAGLSYERLQEEGRVDQQAEFDLLSGKQRKREIEAFFHAKSGSEEIDRLLVEIEDLSDTIHDSVRDRQIDDIPILFPKLERRWKRLQDCAAGEDDRKAAIPAIRYLVDESCKAIHCSFIASAPFDNAFDREVKHDAKVKSE